MLSYLWLFTFWYSDQSRTQIMNFYNYEHNFSFVHLWILRLNILHNFYHTWKFYQIIMTVSCWAILLYSILMLKWVWSHDFQFWSWKRNNSYARKVTNRASLGHCGLGPHTQTKEYTDGRWISPCLKDWMIWRPYMPSIADANATMISWTDSLNSVDPSLNPAVPNREKAPSSALPL